jgi:hypothetical protein
MTPSTVRPAPTHITILQSINAYKFLVVNLDGKRQLGKPKQRLEHNIKMDLTEIRWEGVEWVHLAQDRANSGLWRTQ